MRKQSFALRRDEALDSTIAPKASVPIFYR